VKRSVFDAQAVEKGQLPAGAHNYEAVRNVVLEQILKADLILIDEICFAPMDKTGARPGRELLARRAPIVGHPRR
jgi:hypothetical protein